MPCLESARSRARGGDERDREREREGDFYASTRVNHGQRKRGSRQFLTNIIIIRYLYASVIRSVKFRDNEVSLASQRRNTSHFRISPSRNTFETFPPGWQKTDSSLFLTGIRCSPLKNLRVFARFIHLERKSLGEFSKEQLADISPKETRNAANFNAFFLVLVSRFVDTLFPF